VSERYRKRVDLEAQFDTLRQRLRQERDALQDKLARTRKSLEEELKPGSEAYMARQKEVAMLEAELQWFVDSEGRKVEMGLAQSLRGIFDDIQAVVREIAQQKGYDLVLASDDLPAETPDSPTQVRQFILLQKVLYWSPQVDITEEVSTRLNDRYASSGGAKPIEGGAPANPKRPDGK
jgi:Skp family chaperone for outer membrane proteins